MIISVLHSPYFWLTLSLICLILEVTLPNFIFAIFALGALASGISAFFTNSFYVLGSIFAATSLLSFTFLKPWYFQFLNKNLSKKTFGFQSLMGKVGVITQSIAPGKPGYVKVDADEWKAFADKDLPIGQQVKIIELHGNSVRVNDEI